MSLLTAGTLVLRMGSLVDDAWHGTPWISATMAAGIIQAAAVLGGGLWATLVSSHAFRNLPSSAATAATGT